MNGHPYAVNLEIPTKYWEDDDWAVRRLELQEKHFDWLKEHNWSDPEMTLYSILKSAAPNGNHLIQYQFADHNVAVLFKLVWGGM